MLKKAYKKVVSAVMKITDDEVFTYAAQASFYIITASIPFMMLFLAVMKFFIPITELEAVAMIKTLLPAVLRTPAEAVISELYMRSATVISVTGITAVWSASRGIAAVERGVKKVYKTKQDRGFFTNIAFSLFYTLVFLAALLITLILMVFGGTIFRFLSSHISWLIDIERYFGKAGEFMYFLGISVFFIFIFRVFEGKGAKLKDQILGALFTSLGWYFFSFIFSVYVENFADYSYVYGSLTMLVLMMLWLYSCMVIMLLGAEINVWAKEKRRI